MANYSLTNFAQLSGTFILIYDINGLLRYSIIPSESEFYSSRMNCVIDVHGSGPDRYLMLDFATEADAATAKTTLDNLKSLVHYYVEWSNITDRPINLSGYGITDAYTITQVDTILNSTISIYYNSAQTNANYLSAKTYLDDLYDVNTSGVTTGYYLVYSAGTWVASADSSDFSNYYNKQQSNANFLSASTSYYTQAQTNANFMSATTFDDYYTIAQSDANFLSASTVGNWLSCYKFKNLTFTPGLKWRNIFCI